jgi:hypothetical protein
VALDLAYLTMVAPALATDERALDMLALCEQQHTAARWGDVYSLAMAYLCAHMLTINPTTAPASGGASGAVTSRTAGGTSETYAQTATANASDSELMRTVYGLQYLRLRRSRAATGPRTVNLGGA